MKKASTRNCGFTLLDSIVVTAIIAIGFVLLIPNFRPRRHGCCGPNCVNNLKQVGLAFRQWALDNGDKNPMQVSVTNGGAMEWAEVGSVYRIFSVMSHELNTPRILVCPADKDRTPATVFVTTPALGGGQSPLNSDAYLSYFVGLDADETNPQMFLTGDSNLELNRKAIPHGIVHLGTNPPVTWSAKRHKHQGNVGLADGSVQGYSTARLQEALANTGDLTNRLVFP